MKQKFKELKVNDRVKTLHSGMATVVAVGYNGGTMVKLDCDVKKWNCPYFYEHELDFGEEDIDEQDVQQETLEEAAEKWYDSTEENKGFPKIKAFKDGAKWQQENSNTNALDFEIKALKSLIQDMDATIKIKYSEEDVKNAFLDGWQLRDGDLPFPKAKKKWFNEFKKKQETLEQIVSKQFQKEFNKEVGNVLVQELKKKDMEQTAVEWLSNELYEKFEMKGDGALFNDLVNQAKEMEKQQIENAFNNGYYQETIGYNASEQYYNETFKKK